jgi:hypothetical protein
VKTEGSTTWFSLSETLNDTIDIYSLPTKTMPKASVKRKLQSAVASPVDAEAAIQETIGGVSSDLVIATAGAIGTKTPVKATPAASVAPSLPASITPEIPAPSDPLPKDPEPETKQKDAEVEALRDRMMTLLISKVGNLSTVLDTFMQTVSNDIGEMARQMDSRMNAIEVRLEELARTKAARGSFTEDDDKDSFDGWGGHDDNLVSDSEAPNTEEQVVLVGHPGVRVSYGQKTALPAYEHAEDQEGEGHYESDVGKYIERPLITSKGRGSSSRGAVPTRSMRASGAGVRGGVSPYSKYYGKETHGSVIARDSKPGNSGSKETTISKFNASKARYDFDF